MAKINVNIRLDAELKKQAQVLADKMWTNLSTVINMYLIKFVESWNLEYRKDIPQEELKNNVEKKDKTIQTSNEKKLKDKKLDDNKTDNNSFLSAMN